MTSVSLWSMNEAAWNEIMARWQHAKRSASAFLELSIPQLLSVFVKTLTLLNVYFTLFTKWKISNASSWEKIADLCTACQVHARSSKNAQATFRDRHWSFAPTPIYDADPLHNHLHLPTHYEHLESILEFRWNSFLASHRNISYTYNCYHTSGKKKKKLSERVEETNKE